MTAPLFNLFAVAGAADGDVFKLPVTAALQRELSVELERQLEAFTAADVAPVRYDPQYRPAEDERFEVDFALPERLARLDRAPALEALSDDAIERGTLRALVAVRQAAGRAPATWCFQAVDARQLLRRSRLTLVRSRDVFAANDRSGVVVRDALTAVFVAGKLSFRSDPAVRRFLDLAPLFEEATTPQVERFFAHHAFARADAAALVALADQWTRRKITSITQRRILDTVSAETLARVGRAFGVEVETAREGRRTRIVLPATKKALKPLLRLLDQDYLDSALTRDRFQVNSKRRV